jgi:hypothetical protein
LEPDLSGFLIEYSIPVHPVAAAYIDRLHGRLERLGFAAVDSTAEIACLKRDLAAVRRERDRLGVERDQLNAECHRVTAIAERVIVEKVSVELERDSIRNAAYDSERKLRNIQSALHSVLHA